MTIHDAKKIYDDVRKDGKYVYFYSVWNEGVELFEMDDITGILYYVREFDNMSDCEKYILISKGGE
jgi:hypothetical protein